MFWRRKEVAEETPLTAIDSAVLRMAAAAKRLRALDAEVQEAFTEWRHAQAVCLRESLVVEIGMTPHFTSAFTAWHEHNGGTADSETIHEGWPVAVALPMGDPAA